MTTTLLDVRGLRAGYAGVPVVHDVSFHVGAGEVVAMLGPNGAGKTTILLTVSGLLKPLAGDVAFCGAPITGWSSHRIARAGLAHVTEDRSLFFSLTTNENLRLSARAGGADAVELFPELKPLARRQAGLLSGGEQQMLAIARALASAPKVLMVDEMSLGLAPALVNRLMPRLRQFATQLGIGVLLVEQHVAVALRHVDRAYLLARGRIEAHGAADEMARHAARFEASYLGREAAAIPTTSGRGASNAGTSSPDTSSPHTLRRTT